MRRIGIDLTLSLLLASGAFAQENRIAIAVVRDGLMEPDLTGLIEAELPKHLPEGTRVVFDRRDAFDAQWSPERAAQVLTTALGDSAVDIVLASGFRVLVEAGRETRPLPKPVVSTYLQLSDVFRLPYGEDGRSLKDNLSFTVLPHRVERDLEAFHEMIPFHSLTVLVSPGDLDLLPGIATGLEAYESALSIDVRFAPVEGVDSFFSASPTMEAVYLTRLPRLDRSERTRLIEGLRERHVPTFSLVGQRDVESGALAALTPDVTEQLVRRIALNLARIIRGEPASALPVLLSVDERLQLNAQTAVAVGYLPPLETRIEASVLHEEALDTRSAEPLTESQALSQAETNNKLLSIQDELVESVRKDQDRARSALLPRAALSLGYRKTNVLLDILPEDATNLGLSLKQMIFDDRAISSYRASQRATEGSELQREADRISVLGDAGTAFYGLGLTQALYRVEADNLRRSESFLELARLRRDVGYSGMDEIYRWQATVAQQRSRLFTASEDAEVARITLNRVLGTEQDRRWLLQPPKLDPNVFPFVGGELSSMWSDLASRDGFRDALVDLAIRNAPDIMALDKKKEAFDIRVDALRRRYFVPSAFFSLFYNRTLSGTSNNLPPGEKDLYVFSFGLDYPIFEGGGRQADIGKAEAERRAVERQREFTAELIEQQTRTAMRRTESSFPRIRFTREAAEAAGNNLAIVQDKYAEGIVDVTALISAQNEKFTADQVAAAAEYQFWMNLIELQRALSWFEDEKTPEERVNFVEEIRTFVEKPKEGPAR